ncbi:MAG: hypothetical protein JNL72_15450 [Flavipsychrobacter sp.]|nr:hypothetical protein [Flavipsychrobacter sp.]
MQEAAEPSDYEEFLVKEVRRLPEVKKLEDYILYYSPSMKMAIFLVETEGRGIYTVKVMEDNGAKDPLLHLKYTVDSASGKILKTESKKK